VWLEKRPKKRKRERDLKRLKRHARRRLRKRLKNRLQMLQKRLNQFKTEKEKPSQSLLFRGLKRWPKRRWGRRWVVRTVHEILCLRLYAMAATSRFQVNSSSTN
jgi:hypothetical protein